VRTWNLTFLFPIFAFFFRFLQSFLISSHLSKFRAISYLGLYAVLYWKSWSSVYK
jgi:hypothetical protein